MQLKTAKVLFYLVLAFTSACSAPLGSTSPAMTGAFAVQQGDKPMGQPMDPLLAALQSNDGVRQARAKVRIEKLEDARRVPLLLQGLRSQNQGAATWSASQLEWIHVDPSEARLLVQLLEPEIFKARFETEVNFDEFRYNLGSSELAGILRKLPTAKYTVARRGYMLSHLHRQIRPEHYPILCDIYLSADPELARSLPHGKST